MGMAGVKMASALLIILGLLFLGFYLLKKYGHKAGLGMGSESMLKVVSAVSIGPKKSVVVVRFLNKDLVLGVTDSQINLLTESRIDEYKDHNFAKVLSEKTDTDSS